MRRCLWLVWSLLAWLSAILCTVGCLLPYWLKGHVYITNPLPSVRLPMEVEIETDAVRGKSTFPTDLGLFRRCGYPVYVGNQTTDLMNRKPITWQYGCGHYSHVVDVPHTAWHIAFFALVSACSLLFFATFFLFMLGFALYLLSMRIVYRACQIMLLMAGLLSFFACILYPIGWTENPEIQQACGPEASSFRLGRCHIGWAYVLTCAGGLLSLFAATLPIIFPRHLIVVPTVTTKSQCCFPTKSTWPHSVEGKSCDMFPLAVPSPANSVRTADSAAHQGGMFYPPRNGAHSPTGSSSPTASVLCDHSSSTGPVLLRRDQHPHSTGYRPMTTYISPTQQPYNMCAFVPQRYSTSGLPFINPQTNGFTPLNQRISVAVNPDPLINLAEEEEGDTNAERFCESGMSRGHSGSPIEPSGNEEFQTENPVEFQSSTHHDPSTMSTTENQTEPPRRIQSTTNLHQMNGGPTQFVMLPAVRPTFVPNVGWVYPSFLPPGYAVPTQTGPMRASSEMIKRKRASCML